MFCPNCKEEWNLQIATKINCYGCKILTALTSVATVQCQKCEHVFQIPVQSKTIASVKKDEEEK